MHAAGTSNYHIRKSTIAANLVDTTDQLCHRQYVVKRRVIEWRGYNFYNVCLR